MLDLEQTHPDVYKQFMEGYHCVRQSDRYWAGLSTDLIIEQVLMRSLKTSGGLTRGRGFGEVQRLTWLLGMPARAMLELSGVHHVTSEQHKDIAIARQVRDAKETTTVIQFFQRHNPLLK